MNKTYKVVWSRAKGALVVASELSSSKGKGKSSGSVAMAGAIAITGAIASFGGIGQAHAAPCALSPCTGSDTYQASLDGQISGADFTFQDSSTLVADIPNVVMNFYSINMRNDSVANLTVAGALGAGAGQIAAFDSAQINVDAAGAISGGTVSLSGTSALNVNATGGITGGVQNIGATSTLNLNASGAITGGEQNISGTLSANAADAISGSDVNVNGGALVTTVAGAIRETTVDISNGGVLRSEADGSFGAGVAIEGSGGGGELDLNGHNETIVGLSSADSSFVVTNKGAADAQLDVVASASGSQSMTMAGSITDGPTNGLGLRVSGVELTLTGSNSYTGGTTVAADGTLIGSTSSLTGDFDVQSDGVLRVSQAVAGSLGSNITGDGSLEIGGTGKITLTGTNAVSTHILNGATLVATSDAQLGGVGKALSITGGTLEVGADMTSSRSITITDGATVATNSDVELTGTIGGNAASELTIAAGSGSVTLGGTNSYGNTVVQSGTLLGTSNSIRGNVTNAGTVVYDQAFDGTAVGNMSGAGSFEKRGAGNLRLSGSSDVDWLVSDGTLTATAQQFSGNVNIAAPASFAFDETVDFSYAGIVSGSGNLLKQGAGKLTLTGDSSGFMGQTTVQNGELIVNTTGSGRLGGTLEVLNGGTLKGSGQVGTTTLRSGAVVAPGNSIGTLTVTGDLTFDANSVYEVEVDPGGTSSDRIDVSGTAYLDGQVKHIGFNGTYAASQTYTILTAGAISGTFDSVVSNYAFLDPTLDYTATEVTLELTRNSTPIGSVGNSGNASAVGDAIETLSGSGSVGSSSATSSVLGTQVYNSVIGLSREEAGKALDLLSGEIHASTTSVLLNDSRLLRDVSLKQLRGQFDASPVGKVRKDLAGWAEVVGQKSTLKGDGNATEVEGSVAGLFLGAHADVGSGWRLGASFGYTDGKAKVKDKNSNADITSYGVALVAGNSFDAGKGNGKVNVLAGAAYSWHGIDTKRHVVYTGVNENLSADYKAHTSQIFAEVGYAMPVSPSLIVEPFAGVSLAAHKNQGFSESGGASALTGKSETNSVTTTTLGVRGKLGISSGSTQGVLTAGLGWRRASGDVTPKAVLAFDGGSQFTVTGAPIAKNAAVLDLGANMAISKSTSLGLSYSGQYGSGLKDHAGSVNLRMRF